MNTYSSFLHNAVTILLALGFVTFLSYLMSSEKGRRSVTLAVRGLWLHKLRAFLSVLGIVIGTCAVILLMAFGKGNMEDALADIRRQGATNVIVRSVKPPDDSSYNKRTMIAKYGLGYKD